ncbi:unnamed protein product, partial [Mesorhabditis spiculigera]
MWKIVEETPKKYDIALIFEPPSEWGIRLHVDGPIDWVCKIVPTAAQLPRWALLKSDPTIAPPAASQDKREYTARARYLRLFLNNSSVKSFTSLMCCYGNNFWSSLNMKVEELCNPLDVPSFFELQGIIDHFKPSRFVAHRFLLIEHGQNEARDKFLQSPTVRSLEMLHVSFYFIGDIRCLSHIRAKDLLIAMNKARDIGDWPIVLHFVSSRVWRWLDGTDEIDKFALIITEFGHIHQLLTYYLDNLSPATIGWVDRTYPGMYLIGRASDGQALLAYFHSVEGYFLLLRCDYNFRRGRCLGSYQQNGRTLRNIAELIAKWDQQMKRNPKRVREVKAKLKKECAKFNEYNKGATTIDLMTDSLWRTKDERGVSWGPQTLHLLRCPLYPLDASVRHAYQLTKAYEERGVLPEVDEFRPATDEYIKFWNGHFNQYITDYGSPLIAGCDDKQYCFYRSICLRLFLTNSTVFELRGVRLSYGLEFWASLNMKVTRISYPDGVRTIPQLQQFIDHFKPTQFIMFPKSEDTPLCQRNPTQFIQFLRSPVVCSMEKLHIGVYSDFLDDMHDIKAKDLFINWNILYGKRDPGPKIGYLTQKIMAWLAGNLEIEKLQIWSNLKRGAQTRRHCIDRFLLREIGKIVRKDENMQLIVRASDGQALIAYLDSKENCYNCFYLIRCDYKFRWARPADSYERNAESLRRIRKFMRLASRLSEQNPELSGDVLAKLRGECIKFNAYNKGATKMDLMTDALWRPKSVRRSPWGWCDDGGMLHDILFPIDISTRHAYDFTKAFEERVFFRVLFDNSTIDEFVDAPLSFGNEFWFSLNMKVTRFTEPKAAASVAQLQQFLVYLYFVAVLKHFQPTELIYNHLFVDFIARVAECERFLRSDFIRGLEKLHLFCGYGKCGMSVIDSGQRFPHRHHRIHPRAHLNSIFAFLLRRISDWLHGDEEIDKIQICAGKDIEADKIFGRLVNRVAARMTSDIGWIDRTYEGMELILRGQALLVFWDDADGFFYLIRGRCLGSFQRNEDSLRRIRQLMNLSKQLLERNAELAENAKEKLKNECIKFNAYNNGATTIDLMTDWIWRPKGERRSPWGLVDRIILHDNVNRVDFALLHAYRFAKAFEERGDVFKCDIYGAGWVVLDMVNRSKPGSKDIAGILPDGMSHLTGLRLLVLGCTKDQVEERFDVQQALLHSMKMIEAFASFDRLPDVNPHSSKIEPPYGLYGMGLEALLPAELLTAPGVSSWFLDSTRDTGKTSKPEKSVETLGPRERLADLKPMLDAMADYYQDYDRVSGGVDPEVMQPLIAEFWKTIT